MTTEQAIQFLENISKSAYKNGNVAFTPEAFEMLRKTIEALRPEVKPEKKK